jgi:DNA-binding NtrC family response regulator
MGDTEFNYRKAIEQIQETIVHIQPPKTILIVDDDPNDVCLHKHLFSKYHVKVTTCHDGAEARKTMEKQKFNYIFFDLVMPNEDGLEFVLASLPLNKGTHFFLVTGYPYNTRVAEVLKQGAISLPKPLTEESLDAIGIPRKPKIDAKLNESQ